MGQASIFTLNKVNHSMFWNSLWDDKINFSKSLKEDIFFRNFLEIFFESNSSFKFLKKNYFFLKRRAPEKYYNIFFKYNYKELEKYLIDLKINIIFFSKFWILKYQSWFIIYFYMFDFKISEKKYNIKKSKISNINILIEFYINILNLNSNYTDFKKIYKNKF